MSASLSLTLRRPMQGKGQSVSYTGTAGTSSAPIPQQSNSVALVCSTDAWVALVGTSSAVATTADIPVSAGQMVIIPVERPTAPGTDPNIWVSAVRDSASGTMRFIPLVD